MDLQRLFGELKRRNVFRVATAYAIAGWLIIQICATTFPYLNLPEWLITAVIIFVLIGFPLSVIFAWAFELTPEGLKKSKEVEISESVTKATGKKINGIIITVLSMAVIFLLVERVFFAKASILEDAQTSLNVETASIAVLPFVNMSGDQENEYFSDGLSEELLNALAKVEDMKVAGRTSSFKFKGQNEDLKLVGDQLGVNHILEGSVRKAGGRVRITAQLIKVDDGFHMWSETFDRELTANNIFEIQEEISRKVLGELKVRLLPEEDQELDEIPTQDIEAYQAFLKANQLVINRNYTEIEAAIALYQDAIRLDPTFAEAHGKLALAYNAQAYYGNIPRQEYLENVKSKAETALSIDQNSPSAHAAMALYYQDINELEKAEEQFKTSLEQNPNFVDVYNWLGNLYEDLGERENQFRLYEEGYEIDPLNPLAIYNRIRVSLENEDYEEADFFFDKNIRINPDFIPTYYLKGNVQFGPPFGNMDEAGKYFIQVYNSDNDFPRAMTSLVFTSHILELPGMADHFYEILKTNYYESIEYRSVIGFHENFKGYYNDYTNIYLPYVDEGSVVRQDRFEYFDLRDYAFKTGDFEKVFPFFRKFDAGLFDDTLETLTERTKIQASILAELFYRTGDNDQADRLKDAFCRFTDASKSSYPKGEADVRYQEDVITCLFLSKDYDALALSMKETYQQHNNIGTTFGLLRYLRNDYTEIYADGFQEFDAEVKAELNRQRENLITYLKESGDWKEEWGGN